MEQKPYRLQWTACGISHALQNCLAVGLSRGPVGKWKMPQITPVSFRTSMNAAVETRSSTSSPSRLRSGTISSSIVTARSSRIRVAVLRFWLLSRTGNWVIRRSLWERLSWLRSALWIKIHGVVFPKGRLPQGWRVTRPIRTTIRHSQCRLVARLRPNNEGSNPHRCGYWERSPNFAA